jgi:hypothetical protein
MEIIIEIWQVTWRVFSFISKSDEFGAFFLMKNPLYRSTSYFPGQNGQKCGSKKITGLWVF